MAIKNRYNGAIRGYHNGGSLFNSKKKRIKKFKKMEYKFKKQLREKEIEENYDIKQFN